VLGMCVVGLGAVAVFTGFAPSWARRFPPRTATVLLVSGALVTTGALFAVTGLLAATLAVRVPVLASAGGWSPQVLRTTAPVPPWVAALCGALPPAAALAGTVAVYRQLRGLFRLRRACRPLRSTDPVVVLDAVRPEAFATPGPGGRIVVTTGMLRGLEPAEVRALLAHERSHLRHGHAWWVLVAQACAAFNPTLRPLARSVSHAVERWADEDAAAEVKDRQVVARAIARAALRTRGSVPAGAMASGGSDVPARVRCLLDGPPREHRAAAVAVALLTVVTFGWAAGVADRTDDFFDGARRGVPPAVTR
jgi:hypothetical protein